MQRLKMEQFTKTLIPTRPEFLFFSADETFVQTRSQKRFYKISVFSLLTAPFPFRYRSFAVNALVLCFGVIDLASVRHRGVPTQLRCCSNGVLQW